MFEYRKLADLAFSLVGFTSLGLLFVATGCNNFSAQGLNAEGVRYYQQGNYQAAMDRFTRAINDDPANPDAYYNLASYHHQMGKKNSSPADSNQAESYYNQCLDNDPDHVEAYRGLAVLLVEQGRPDDGLRLLSGWARQSPNKADPLVELSRLQQELGEKEAAKESLLEAIAVDEYDARARSALGAMYEEEGKFQQALKNYQLSLSRDQFQPQLRTRVASLQTALGSTAPAGTPAGGGANTRVVNATQPSALR